MGVGCGSVLGLKISFSEDKNRAFSLFKYPELVAKFSLRRIFLPFADSGLEPANTCSVEKEPIRAT